MSGDGTSVMSAMTSLVIKSKDTRATSFSEGEVKSAACGTRDFEADSVYPDDDPAADSIFIRPVPWHMVVRPEYTAVYPAVALARKTDCTFGITS